MYFKINSKIPKQVKNRIKALLNAEKLPFEEFDHVGHLLFSEKAETILEQRAYDKYKNTNQSITNKIANYYISKHKEKLADRFRIDDHIIANERIDKIANEYFAELEEEDL